MFITSIRALREDEWRHIDLVLYTLCRSKLCSPKEQTTVGILKCFIRVKKTKASIPRGRLREIHRNVTHSSVEAEAGTLSEASDVQFQLLTLKEAQRSKQKKIRPPSQHLGYSDS